VSAGFSIASWIGSKPSWGCVQDVDRLVYWMDVGAVLRIIVLAEFLYLWLRGEGSSLLC
jgi:hypothetical protein